MSDLQYSAYYRDAKLLTGKELKTLKASIKRSSSFPFVKLPAGVRHMIYREVTAESWCPYIFLHHSEDRRTYWEAVRIGDGLDIWSLVRACKIIHREALGYFYERSHFTLKTAATVEGRIPSVIPGMMERCELVFIHAESFDPRFEEVMEWLYLGKHLDRFSISSLHPRGPCSGIDQVDALRKYLDMWQQICFPRRVSFRYCCSEVCSMRLKNRLRLRWLSESSASDHQLFVAVQSLIATDATRSGLKEPTVPIVLSAGAFISSSSLPPAFVGMIVTNCSADAEGAHLDGM